MSEKTQLDLAYEAAKEWKQRALDAEAEIQRLRTKAVDESRATDAADIDLGLTVPRSKIDVFREVSKLLQQLSEEDARAVWRAVGIILKLEQP